MNTMTADQDRPTPQLATRYNATMAAAELPRDSHGHILVKCGPSRLLTWGTGAMSPLTMRPNMRCMRTTLGRSASVLRAKGNSPVRE